MAHKSHVFSYECSPAHSIKILDDTLQAKLRDTLVDFAKSLSAAQGFPASEQIARTLNALRLQPDLFIETFTRTFIHKK
jgi:hypothetical protein